MKTTCLVGFVGALLLPAMLVRADEASYAAIVKERDSVLSQIVSELEARRASGLQDPEAIAAAQIALYSFRREASDTTAEKIRNQELIVAVYADTLELVASRVAAGVCGRLDELTARAAYLEAKQTLEKLRLSERQG